jgi:hypothetical protein
MRARRWVFLFDRAGRIIVRCPAANERQQYDQPHEELATPAQHQQLILRANIPRIFFTKAPTREENETTRHRPEPLDQRELVVHTTKASIALLQMAPRCLNAGVSTLLEYSLSRSPPVGVAAGSGGGHVTMSRPL